MSKRRVVWAAVLFPLFLMASPHRAVQADDLERRIHWLIEQIEKSECTFIRNDVEYKGKDAAAHVRKKYEHFKAKGKIHSVEDFVTCAASESLLTGKPYLVKTQDGKTVPVKDWLLTKYKDEYRDGRDEAPDKPK